MIESFRRGERAPIDVADETLGRIEAVDARLNAFVTLTADLASAQAAAAGRAYGAGAAGPLAGVPVAIKDLVDVADVPTSMGSLVHQGRVADADSPLVARIRAAGAVIVGKTTTSEYGWKGESGNRVNGPAHNPWRHGLTAGGSSGGSAAAVAAGVVRMAQGGDGAGSIRIPASFCGVFGLKPTVGLVPTVPGSGLSAQGPIARTVADAALLLDVMAATSHSASLDEGVDGVRAAWSADLGLRRGRGRRARGRRRRREAPARAGPAARGRRPRASTIRGRSSTRSGPGTRRRTRTRRSATSPTRAAGRWSSAACSMTEADHAAALEERARYTAAMDAFFERHDLLVTPTMPCPPFRAGADQPGWVAGRPTEYLSWTAFTYPFNVTGQPAASVPCGRDSDGLPVGLQIVGRRGEDALVLRAARAFERAFPWSYDGLDLV